MNISSLPTDSLYKFLALLGAIIMISLIISLSHSCDSIIDKIDAYEINLAELNFEIAIKNKKLDEFIKELEILESEIDRYDISSFEFNLHDFEEIIENLQNVDNRDYYQFIFDNKEDIFPEIRKLNELKIKMKNIDELENDLSFKSLQIDIKRELIIKTYNRLDNRKFYYYSGIMFGLIMMILGFILWYFKVQRYIDRDYKNDK